MSNTKKLIAAALAIFVVGYAFGRYAQPAKIKVETQVVKDENKKTETESVTDTDRDKKKTIIKVEITKPDGTKEVKTKTVEDTSTKRRTDIQTKQDEQKHTEMSKSSEIEYKHPATTLSVLAGTSVKDVFHGQLPNACYGGHVQRQIFGPISIGVWGLSTGTGGASVGLSF